MGSWRASQGPPPSAPAHVIGQAVYGESRKTSAGLLFRGSSKHVRIDVPPSGPASTSRYGRRVVNFVSGKTCFPTVDALKQTVESPAPTPPHPTVTLVGPLSVMSPTEGLTIPGIIKRSRKRIEWLNNNKNINNDRLVHCMNHSSSVTGAFGEVISLDSISSAWAKPSSLPPAPSRLDSS